MMRSTILAHDASPIEAEHHMKVSYRHIMYDVVIGTLCKGTVDITERYHALFCQSPSEGGSMSLSNTHVKGPVRHCLHEFVHRAASRHSRRDAHYLVISLRQFHESLAKDILVLSPLILIEAFARLRIKASRGMPYRSRLFSRLIAFSLNSVNMKQFRATHILQLANDTYQFLDIMSVNRSEIAYVHALEDILLL